MANAAQCNFAIGAVKARDREYGIAVVKNIRCIVGVREEKLVSQQKGLWLNRKISQAGGIDADDGAVGRVTIEKAVGKDALTKFAVTAVKARTTENAGGNDGAIFAFFCLRGCFDMLDHILCREERNGAHFLGEPECTIGFGKDDQAVNTLIDIVKALHAFDELKRGTDGTFESFVHTVVLVLIEAVALAPDFALPIFYLDDKRYVAVNYHEVLFKIELFVRYDHVTYDAIEAFEQCAVDDLLADRAKLFNFLHRWQMRGTCTLDCGFQQITH